MLYFVRQWGEQFFEVTKLKGYKQDMFFGYGTEICEKDFSKLVTHCKPCYTDSYRIHSNRAYSEVLRWRGEGKANDIIPGLYPEVFSEARIEDVLNKLGIH